MKNNKAHSDVLHHIHLRKRVHKNLEQYPHPNKLKFYLDKLIMFIAIGAPLMTLPQIFEIWFYQNAIGVSAISWMAMAFMAFIWLLYGIAHKEKPIIICNFLWMSCDLIIVIGTFMYS
jgi:uncharacterized protein with PQ loop repeat